MTTDAELAACRQALIQYRRAWRELSLTVASFGAVRTGFVADVMSEIARKHGLPAMPPADETKPTCGAGQTNYQWKKCSDNSALRPHRRTWSI